MPFAITGLPGQLLGGYVAGLAAADLAGAVQVDLHRPVPAAAELRQARDGDGRVLLLDGKVAATARPARAALPDAPRVDLGAARRAAGRYPLRPHPSPTCAVCGTCARGPLGLPIRPGPIATGTLVAASWRPTRPVTPELVWAVLDCPGFWALDLAPPAGVTRVVTARMTARLLAPVEPGSEYLALGWPTYVAGRSVGVASALRHADGPLVAVAEQMLVATDWGWPVPRRSRGAAPDHHA